MQNKLGFIKNHLPDPYLPISPLERGPFDMPLHSHDFWQLIAVTDGLLTVRTESSCTTLSTGMVHILPPGQFHSLHSQSGYTQLGIDLIPLSNERNITALLTQYISSPVVLRPEHTASLAAQIAEKEEISSPLALSQMAALLDLLVLDCIEAVQSSEQRRFDCQLLAYLDENLACPLCLDDIAAHFYLSIPQLERLCHAAFHSGVMAQLQARRYRRAGHLLINTELPIQEIGRIVGYPEPSHFSGFFRRHSGLSPRAYRARFRQYTS
ncbi:MAG: helix-turn-helix domain-containing protein [Lachnospiraceae bacterium]|nr:helix-turn-helix domain-containing protein [Lachnospiraceae bacterium]